jgi:hypothetical protein
MSEKKGWGNTVVGWFIVDEDAEKNVSSSVSEADMTADELIAKYANQTPYTSDSAENFTSETKQNTVAIPSDYGTPPPVVDGKVDFESVFEAGGVDAEERERIEKAKSLLDSLPATTDIATKKQIVEASLSAFGVPIEKIIEAGVAEIEALEYYIRSGASDTEVVLKESSERIQQYEREIANLRKIMEERIAEQNTSVAACNAKKLEVQAILEFFGRDVVAQVVKESPKLHEPEIAETTQATETAEDAESADS